MDISVPELQILWTGFDPDDQVEYQPDAQEFRISVPSEGPLLIAAVSGQIGSELRVLPARLKLRISRAWFDRMAALVRDSS